MTDETLATLTTELAEARAALEAPKGTPLEWVHTAGEWTEGSWRSGPWIIYNVTPGAGSDRFTYWLSFDPVRNGGVYIKDNIATLESAQALAQRLADVLGSES